MKSVIALCFLTVCCTVDATTLKSLLLQVWNTKAAVENTIRQLEHTRDNVVQDVNLTVITKWSEQMKKYDKYADSTLDIIRKEVEDAKAKGKNAQPCYDAALNIFKNIDFTADTDARQCQKSAESSIKTNLSTFIDNLITTGHELMEELDNIFPDCYEKNSRLSDILKLQSCIIKQFGISKIKVKNLKTDARSAGSTAKSAFNVTLQQAINCLNIVYSTAHSKVAEARSAATICLNNV